MAFRSAVVKRPRVEAAPRFGISARSAGTVEVRWPPETSLKAPSSRIVFPSWQFYGMGRSSVRGTGETRSASRPVGSDV